MKKVSVRYRDNIAILDVTGVAIGGFTGGYTRDELNTALQEQIDQGRAGIILNLERVLTIDTVALGMLVRAYTQLAKKETKIVLLNVGKDIEDLLSLIKLGQVFEKYNDENEALESFKKGREEKKKKRERKEKGKKRKKIRRFFIRNR